MPIILTIVLIILAIAVHELGHAILMRHYGVAISEICILGVGPKLLSFRCRKFFGDTPITVRLFPLGAFVKPAEPMDNFIGNKQYEHIFVGGIAMNFLYTGFLVGIFSLLIAFRGNVIAPVPLLLCLASSGIGLCLWKLPRVIGYIVPILGFSVLAFIIYNLTTLPIGESVAGPIGIGMLVAKINAYSYGLLFGAFISINLGIINMLPLFPLDGGQIFLSVLHRRRPVFMARYGTMIKTALFVGMICLFVLAFGSDISKLLP
ncbi:MAG: site-2 protease family protein [bacterium]|nr:site-2 protease family protein [bacterium]